MIPTIRLVLTFVFSVLVSGCVTVPTMTKAEIKNKVVLESQKKASYIKLAHYWDDHATKQMIDFKGPSYLTLWENEGRAEITIGNGPYYGMIELIAIDKNTTLIRCYAWGDLEKRVMEWKDLIEHAPEE